MNRQDILQIIGKTLGNVARRGPTPADMLASAYGGMPSDYDTIVNHYQWEHALAAQARHVGYPSYTKERIAAEMKRAEEWSKTAGKGKAVAQRMTPEHNRERIADLLAFDKQLGRQLEEAKARDEQLTPWEIWERDQAAAAERREVAEHEARHATVAIDLGCRIGDIVSEQSTGYVYFLDIPSTASLAVSVAGSVYDASGLADPTARHDRATFEAEIDRRFPDATPRERKDASDHEWHNATELVKMILAQRWEFNRALADLLLEKGRVIGYEAHKLWDSIYSTEQ